MNVPQKNHPAWADIVTGKKTYTLKFLAAKIMLGRIVRTVSSNPNPAAIQGAVDELQALFVKNEKSSSVQADLKTIFG